MSFAADGEITARIETEGQGFFQSEIAADDGEEPPRLPRPVPPLASASVAFEEGSLAVPTVRQDEAIGSSEAAKVSAAAWAAWENIVSLSYIFRSFYSRSDAILARSDFSLQVQPDSY